MVRAELTEQRVYRSGTPPPLKTEAPRQTGPESRVTGKETQEVPPAIRRWVPPSLISSQHGQSQEAKNDAIYRKVRGILNKLTPEKFQQLTDDLLKIDLNSTTILNGVIYLIFEKALDEPKYSSMYAQLCKRLSKEAPNFDPTGHRSTFLRLLLNVCRDKFVNRTQTGNIVAHDGPLTPDEEEKKYVAKQKMLGNAKFIGELCKLDMLSGSISHFCIQTLLDITGSKAATIQDRCENIECLCQLIRTCGKNLDTEQGKGLMDQYFDKMAGCANNPKYPPRIRFMLRDVIELRRNNWIPRKINTTEGPVPIHQLKTDDDDVLIRPGYMNHRMHDRRNNDREPDSWMNKLPLNLQPGLNDMMFGSLSVSSPSPIIPTYNNGGGRGGDGGGGGNNYNNRNRDGGDGGGRYNNQRNNHQNNYNSRYNNNGGGKHGGGNNQSGGGYNNSSSHNNSFATGMLSNKDLAPRFKRALIPAGNNDSVENLQMRPAANSLLFKANMNIKTTLPLSQPPSTTKLNNNSGSGVGGYGSAQGHNHESAGNAGSHHKNGGGENGTAMSPSPLTNSNNTQKVSPAPIKTILDKEPILIKQASLEKPNKQKKPKGPTKEEVLKKVTTFVADTLLSTTTDETQNINDVVTEFLELKVPEKFIKDSVIHILFDVLEKNDQVCDRVIEFFKSLKKQNKFHQSLMESIKAMINGMGEREATIPRVTTLVASLLSRFVSTKLVKLAEVAAYTENGQHYPLFLLILQQLHKTMGKGELAEVFIASKVNLMLSLPEVDRNKDRMAEILEDRNLSFLYPLLKVQAELWRQIQVDPNPTQFYKWIKENVEATCLTDPGFITALMTVLLKYITQVSRGWFFHWFFFIF